MSELLTTVTGDASHPKIVESPAIIAHICNDVGGWGAGFTGALSRRDKRPEWDYDRWCANRSLLFPGITPFQLGQIKFAPYRAGITVCNMIAQEGIGPDQMGRPPIRYNFLLECLRRLAEIALAFDAEVHMPKIGAGLAGGDWKRIEEMIFNTLAGVPVTVYVLP